MIDVSKSLKHVAMLGRDTIVRVSPMQIDGKIYVIFTNKCWVNTKLYMCIALPDYEVYHFTGFTYGDLNYARVWISENQDMIESVAGSIWKPLYDRRKKELPEEQFSVDVPYTRTFIGCHYEESLDWQLINVINGVKCYESRDDSFNQYIMLVDDENDGVVIWSDIKDFIYLKNIRPEDMDECNRIIDFMLDVKS